MFSINMHALNFNSDLLYLNKLVDKYNRYINKKPIYADYSASTEKIETNPKVYKLKEYF